MILSLGCNKWEIRKNKPLSVFRQEKSLVLRRHIAAIISILVVLLPAFLSAGEVNLPKTGQTTCYDEVGNIIDCAGTGQDGDIQAGVAWPEPRFEDNGDGTVTDYLTGLVWLKNANCLGPMNWDSALTACNSLASGTCGLTDGSSAGDWRLPNVVELESLINADFIAWPGSNQGFYGLRANYYWSGTTLTGSTDIAWIVYVYFGYVQGWGKSNDGYVWPVRGATSQVNPSQTWRTAQTTCYDTSGNIIDCPDTGQDGNLQLGVAWPEPRFEDNGDGTVTDNLTGLIWLKNANCFGATAWQDALNDCNTLSSGSCDLADNSVAGDWRLPNRKELLSLIDFSQYDPALPIDHPFISVKLRPYWANTTLAGMKESA